MPIVIWIAPDAVAPSHMGPRLKEPSDNEGPPVSPARLGEFCGGGAGNFRRLVGGSRATDRKLMGYFCSTGRRRP